MSRMFMVIPMIFFMMFNVFGVYKNVIFDLGGVILEGDIKSFVLSMIGADPQCDPHLATATKIESWNDWDKGLITREELISVLEQTYKRTELDALFSLFMAPTRPFSQECLTIIKTLKAQGYKLYVLSNFSAEMYDRFIVPNKHVFDHFDGMLFSYQTGKSKPDLDFYRELLSVFGLIPEVSVFIDDSEINVQAAISLNIKGIHYKAGTLQEELANIGCPVC